MSDKFTEVTSQSWSSRIGGAFKGILFGIVLVLVGVKLLFWNEGRAVKTYKALDESQRVVVSVDAREITPAMNGKLVHISGTATTEETLADEMFHISENALKLRRNVETYQWDEISQSEEKKQLGGDVETVTTYEYKKVWSARLIDSSEFKQQAGHENPGVLPYQSEEWKAGRVTIGQCILSDEHKFIITNYEKLNVPPLADLPKGVSQIAGQFYYGIDPQKPSIGDQRISYEIVRPQLYSAVGGLFDSNLAQYSASNGQSIVLIRPGHHTADAMFEKAKSDNENLTWILRAVGLGILVIAFGMILKPLSVLADVVPFLGNIVQIGTGFVAWVLGIIVTLLTVSIAWFFYRPYVAVAFLVAIGILLYVLKRKSTFLSTSAANTIDQQNTDTPSAVN